VNGSLIDEYRRLLPGIKKIFIVPEIQKINKDTSYLYQFYKELLNTGSPLKAESFNAKSLPQILLSRLKFEKAILHYHWFEFEDLKSLIGIKWKLFWIILFKIFGGKIVWTVHNKYPHHNKYMLLNKFFRKMLAKLADRIHVHCKTVIDIVAPVLKIDKEKIFVSPHPVFPAKFLKRDDAINYLNKNYFEDKLLLNDKIFLMFGAIAEYKGIKEVINIFKDMNGNKKLIIAGFVKKGAQSYFDYLKNIADKKQIFLAGRMIPDEEVPYFLNSADCLIFNYRDILTSGGVYLALSYNKPAVAPLSGCLKEIRSEFINFFETDNNRIKNLFNAINNFSGR
jgi:beta-1,4-mannosyltransferase